MASKLETNANKCTFVWAKSIKTNRGKITKQLKELWRYVERVYADEEQIPNTPDLKAIDLEKASQTIDQINTALADKPIDKKGNKKLNYAKKN